MATIALTTAVSATGVSGLAGAALMTGATVAGSYIDNQLFAADAPNVQGPRLSDLSVQSSAYATMIPILYGTTRIAGNIIWGQPIKERATTTSSGGGGKGGPSVSQSSTTYSYYATLALAICEGEIDDVLRVWADSELIDPETASSQYRLYKGGEDQLPDVLIEAFEGTGNAPAYRGVAYVIIEDFPLAEYGNRIPNFTFEVQRKIIKKQADEETLEESIKGMVVIPGSGEFVYDTIVQFQQNVADVFGEYVANGEKVRINQNNTRGKADALVSLDQLQETCPNLEWVAPVVSWFGSSTNAANCTLYPAVEFKGTAITSPDEWSVAGFNRSTAARVTYVDDRPLYGGTVNDASVLRYVSEIKSRGLKVLFLPLMFVDQIDKPWRGRITGDALEVADFFTKVNGYNSYILHYANLLKGKVDAFAIGSELVGLTKVQAADNSFPAVDALRNLASQVRAILGPNVKITYAADWSEYHHEENGWYNLDSLWADPNIDIVGIDAYFPLTNAPQSDIETQDIIDGWSSGEGFDFYYTDAARTNKAPLADAYAWKNIEWWWKNTHVNPDAATTAWIPESKPIWFTEIGYPSLDGATNEPNVFYDPNSVEGKYPRFSRGFADFSAQRQALKAAEAVWGDSLMVTERFTWTWDARPFPEYPDLLTIWSDGNVWALGHWVNGKLGTSSLGGIIADLCERAGIAPYQYDVTRLDALVDGLILSEQSTVRDAINVLRQAYFFDGVESANQLKFDPRGGVSGVVISEDELYPITSAQSYETLRVMRMQERNLPQKVDISYIDKLSSYQVGNQHAQRAAVNSQEKLTLNVPLVMSDQLAKSVADVALYRAWLERTSYTLTVPMHYATLEPTDVINVIMKNAQHTMRITSTELVEEGRIEIKAIAEDISTYDFNNATGKNAPNANVIQKVGATSFELLDLPLLPNETEASARMHIAAVGQEAGWRGMALFRSDDEGQSFEEISRVDVASTMGVAATKLENGPAELQDVTNIFTVVLLNGELESVSKTALLNGANAALVGGEIIQFQSATLVGEKTYVLSGLLRGRLGTEHEMASHSANERFVLLRGQLKSIAVASQLRGLERHYKAVTIGATLAATQPALFAYNGQMLKPYNVVHVRAQREITGDVLVSWTRRDRLNAGWQDGVDMPMSESEERYEIEILDAGEVVHLVSSSQPSFTYTAANQLEDFGAMQELITCRIYQFSSLYGRGQVTEISV